MITTAGYNVGFIVISYIISLFPAGSGFPPQVHTAVSELGGYFSMLAPIIPITTLVTIVALTFTIEIAFFGWCTVKYLISHLPFLSSNG